MKRTVAILGALAVCGAASTAFAYQVPAFVASQQQARMTAQVVSQKAGSLAMAAGGLLGYGNVKAAAQRTLRAVQRAAQRFVRRPLGAAPAVLKADASRMARRYQAASMAFAALSPSASLRYEMAGIASDLARLEALLASASAAAWAPAWAPAPAPAWAPAPAAPVVFHSYGQDVRPVVYPTVPVTYRPLAAKAPVAVPAVSVSWYFSK